eukprot:12372815-Prorocentrum_lima.AAC.1
MALPAWNNINDALCAFTDDEKLRHFSAVAEIEEVARRGVHQAKKKWVADHLMDAPDRTDVNVLYDALTFTALAGPVA